MLFKDFLLKPIQYTPPSLGSSSGLWGGAKDFFIGGQPLDTTVTIRPPKDHSDLGVAVQGLLKAIEETGKEDLRIKNSEIINSFYKKGFIFYHGLKLYKNGCYEHFKGSRYTLIDLALDESTCQLKVIYKGPNEIVWVRDIDSFTEMVDEHKHRFEVY